MTKKGSDKEDLKALISKKKQKENSSPNPVIQNQEDSGKVSPVESSYLYRTETNRLDDLKMLGIKQKKSIKELISAAIQKTYNI